ncbi:hypothetical protein CSB45_15540, partial [candidate division KSB3 bacterium]
GAASWVWDHMLSPTFDFFYTYAVEPTYDFALGLGSALLFPRPDPTNASFAYKLGRGIGGVVRTGVAGYFRLATLPFRWASHADYRESGVGKKTLRDLSLAPYDVIVKRKNPSDPDSKVIGVKLVSSKTGKVVDHLNGYKVIGYRIHKYKREEEKADGAHGINGLLLILLNGSNGHTVGAFRGTSSTVGMTGYEWRQDAIQGAGFESAIYNWAIETAREVHQTYGGIDFFTGHSLGGGLSQVAAAATGSSAYIFNSAGVHPNTLAKNGIDPDRLGKNVYGGNVFGEILNLGQDLLPIPSVSGQRSMSLPFRWDAPNILDIFRLGSNHGKENSRKYIR